VEEGRDLRAYPGYGEMKTVLHCCTNETTHNPSNAQPDKKKRYI